MSTKLVKYVRGGTVLDLFRDPDAIKVIRANAGGGSSSLTFSTGLTNASGTITSNLSTGVSGGQSIVGGTAAGNSLTLSSTSNGTKGTIIFGNSQYDEVNNRLGIGITPTVPLQVKGTGNTNASTAVRIENSDASRAWLFRNDGFIMPANDATNQIGAFGANNLNAVWAAGVAFGNNSQTGTFGISTGATSDFNITISSNQAFIVRTNNTQRIYVQNSGRVAFGTSTSPTATIHIQAGTTSASSAPIKFTAGTNMTTAEAGAIEYDGTNLFFTRAGTTRENVLVAVDNASAPSTAAAGTVTNRYGGGTNFLGDPNRWASVNILGSVYKIPLYT